MLAFDKAKLLNFETELSYLKAQQLSEELLNFIGINIIEDYYWEVSIMGKFLTMENYYYGEVPVIASEAKQSQRLRLLRFARNDSINSNNNIINPCNGIIMLALT